MTNLNSETFPVLTTERLTLRQLSNDDHQDIFTLRSDPEINKFLNRPPCRTTEDAISFINKVNENIVKGNSCYWAITMTDTKTLVGTICLFDFSSENNSCEIGYELMTKFQGQGIMQEAAQVVIDYVFQTLKFKVILAITHYGNQNSTNLLLKFNFVKSIKTDKDNPDLNIFTLTH
jgi:[ribosomal protein S5]-alanine N-acetyltransferase